MAEEKDVKAGTNIDEDKAVAEIMRFLMQRGKLPQEFVQFRRQIIKERDNAHMNIIEKVAKQANVDLDSIYKEARLLNKIKRQKMTETLEKIDAEVAARAAEERNRHEMMRKRYLKDFGQLYKEREGNPELKFKYISNWNSSAVAAPGCLAGVMPWTEPDMGAWEASASVNPDPLREGAILKSRIYTDHGDCRHSGHGVTDLMVVMRRQHPIDTFLADNISVNLWGTGGGLAVVGDDCPDPNPNSMYLDVRLTVSFVQLLNGRMEGPWIPSSLDNLELFGCTGEYNGSINFDIAADTFPCHLFFRGPDLDGGEIFCFIHIRTRAYTVGSDGRAVLDCQSVPHGIVLGCVSLIGEYA